MRILLPIIQFPPDVNPTGVLMAQLAEGLVARGHEVLVITAFPHYEDFRVWAEYRRKLMERDRYGEIEIVRHWVYAPGNKTMINRLLSYLSYNLVATAVGAFQRRAWDVVLCPNGSFFTGLSAWLLEKMKAAPFIYNVQDLYPDVPIRAGQLRNRSAIAMLRAMERFMYRKAAHVTVISESMRENLLAKGVPAEKISLIPNFVDTEFMRPGPRANPFARQHGLADKFVVAYAGNLGYVYDLDTLLDAARLLSAQKDIVFLIVGNGVAKSALEGKAREQGLTNVRFMPFQPREALPLLRAASDVQVCLQRSGAAGDSFPSKIYEILASGRALIASSEAAGDVERLMNRAGCGIVVPPGNAAAVSQAILRLYGDALLRDAMGRSGRRYVEEHHSKSVVVTSYDALLHKMVAEKASRGARQALPQRFTTR